jgi:uncharacterized protein YbcC (UPF0753/DUF2309 family)
MKKLKILITCTLFFDVFFAFSQCNQCQIKDLCNEFIGSKYQSLEQRDLIKNNWTDFAGTNVENNLHNSKLPMTSIVTIKLDGLGCLYPMNQNLSKWKELFLDKHYSESMVPKNSFYHLFFEFNGVLDSFFSDSQDIDFKESLRPLVTE